ncbi:MAG: Gfo/Idh/MocA family oxidoreductase [Planctomycetota bacterium]
MTKQTLRPIFDTKKRIRLGIWGLGRGMSFFKSCAALNIDVVAGCDYNEHMRNRFQEFAPNAFVTSNAEEFLSRDFDAVLVATFCPAHADDAIACLKAGKHVLSEVTSFHTMEEGVRLVEAVEKSGLVYNLAENYPFSRANMYLEDQWRKGLFGDLMYAEYEYVHECRRLVYTYIDGLPIIPGNTVHNWRSWINFHYYNTHSLGPVMHITKTRPTRVVSLPSENQLAGYIFDGKGGANPSLISMSNGGIMRNLMGATTNDTHYQRLWGTLGAAEIAHDGLRLRLGGSGHSPKFLVDPKWPILADHAEKTGHGGGDFWILYYFAREILFGEPAPFDIYNACDCTIPGLLAYRSAMENGRPFDVPNFRDKKLRAKFRNDDYAQKRYDVKKGCFPKNADMNTAGKFSTVMANLIDQSLKVRAYLDWEKVFDDVTEKDKVAALATDVIDNYAVIAEAMKAARTLANQHPGSDAARVINEMLEHGREDNVLSSKFLADVKKRRSAMNRRIKKPAAH